MLKSIRTYALLSAATGLVALGISAPILAKTSHRGHKQAAVAAPTRNIVETAVGSADHTTLVAAVKAAGLVETLSSPGPFTVFAPTNAAFAKLPAGTVETLVKPEQKAALTKILTYHVVAGNVSARQLIRMIRTGGGKAELTTVSGGKISASVMAGKVVLTDEMGGQATVVQADLAQTNGVIHVTDTVSLPR